MKRTPPGHREGRTPVWKRRLTFVALGGIAGGASVESGEAALVVVSDDTRRVDSNTPVDGSGRIDLNGDGTADFGIVLDSGFGPDAAGYNFVLLGGGQGGAGVAYSAAQGEFPAALEAGGTVGVGGPLSFRSTGIGFIAASSGPGPGGTPALFNGDGNWFGGNDAFVGVRFASGGQDLFGWVHLVWDPACGRVTIDQWAYEDSGAAAVIAPEPIYAEVSIGRAPGPSGDSPQLGWDVHCGETYKLERSTNLEDWSEIYSVMVATDGQEVHVDTEIDMASDEKVFYRVEILNAPLAFLAMGMRRGRRASRRKDARLAGTGEAGGDGPRQDGGGLEKRMERKRRT